MYMPNITETHQYDDTTKSKESETNTHTGCKTLTMVNIKTTVFLM